MIISDLQYIELAAETEVQGGTGELVAEPKVPGDDLMNDMNDRDSYRRPRRQCGVPND